MTVLWRQIQSDEAGANLTGERKRARRASQNRSRTPTRPHPDRWTGRECSPPIEEACAIRKFQRKHSFRLAAVRNADRRTGLEARPVPPDFAPPTAATSL